MSESYTDAETRAFTRMSWWEYAAKVGLPTRVSHPAEGRIERGCYAVKQKPVRDYLSEPLDYDDWRL